MRLDPAARDELAREVTARLRAAAPKSVVALRGSLARGDADEFSDVDMLWEVPDSLFLDSVTRVGAILGGYRPVESLRSDPDLQNSARHRLLFVRFAGQPLFYRLDLEVFAESAGRDESCDLDSPTAKGDNWSPAESALANAVLAVKHDLRGNYEASERSLRRAYCGLGREVPVGSLPERLRALVDIATAVEPASAGFGERVAALAGEAGA